jgi:hypothetical protein
MKTYGTPDDFLKITGLKKNAEAAPNPPAAKPAGAGASSSEPKPEQSAARTPAAESSAPDADTPKLAKPKSARRADKAQRAAKPKGLAPDAKINLNCTLARRDAINAAAESLGLTTTAYLLYCEEKAVHQLVKHFTVYIETRDQMAVDKLTERLDRIEEFLKQRAASR